MSLCKDVYIKPFQHPHDSWFWRFLQSVSLCYSVYIDFKVDSFDRPPGVNPQGSCSDLEARGTNGAMNLQRSIWSRKNLKLSLIRISHWRICKMNPIETLLWRQPCDIPYLPYAMCIAVYHNIITTVWHAYNFWKCLGLALPQETVASARERFWSGIAFCLGGWESTHPDFSIPVVYDST